MISKKLSVDVEPTFREVVTEVRTLSSTVTTLSTAVGALGIKVDALTVTVSELSETVSDVIDVMRTSFDRMEARMDLFEMRFCSLEEGMERGFHEVNRRLGNLENGVEELREEMVCIGTAVDTDSETIIDHENRITHLEFAT